MKLAISQIALGLLILAIVLTCPGYLFVVAVPGLAVLGVGTAQLIRARRLKGFESHAGYGNW